VSYSFYSLTGCPPSPEASVVILKVYEGVIMPKAGLMYPPPLCHSLTIALEYSSFENECLSLEGSVKQRSCHCCSIGCAIKLSYLSQGSCRA